MILLSLIVDAVELRDGRGGADQVRVPQESPHLLERHGERLLALVRLDLPRILSIPVLEL